MSPSVALNPDLLNHPTPNSGRTHTLHFTPIVPKRKLSTNTDVSNSDNGHTLNLSNKRYNRSNSVAANDQTTVNPVATIKISRKWVLPPRPKPGRKTFLNASNTPNSTSSTTVKRRTQSVPAIPPVNSGPHNNNNNNNILHKTNLSKKNSDNYLAFLKFDSGTSTLNKPSVNDDTLGKQGSTLSTTSTQNDNPTSPFTSNDFSIVKSPGENPTTTTTTTSVSSAISTTSSTSTALQRESSLSHTAITAPTSDLCLSLNKLHSFTFNNDNIDTMSNNNNNNSISKELDLACDQDMPSTVLSSFASNASSYDNMMGPANSDEFIEKTTNDELKNEIYNNIWNFLSRYNSSIDNGTVTTTDGDKDNDNDLSSERNNASTGAAVNGFSVYFYSAPSLEELMDKQNTDSNNLRNLGLALQD